MDPDMEALLAKQLKLTGIMIAVGVHPIKVVHSLATSLKEHCQRGSMSLEEMTHVVAVLAKWTDEYADGWARGYAEGWAAAVLRILEQRDVPISDEIHGYISSRTDLKALADWLDLAPTVSHAKELVPTNPRDVG
ncbi:hypothetical protein [Streptomyces sp. NPDC001530]|uniref:hypothetical protein n=1 Tax=Streptomyces sp. NPDC001530 TaxID=3364582 RepID=UPI0036BDB035